MVQMVTRQTSIELVRGEMLDVVKLGELAAGVGRDELLELAFGLSAEIGAVHEEEDALRAGVFDEAVGEGAGGVGLARAGGHLDQRARVGLGERLFEVGDRLDLAVAHAARDERMGGRHRREASAQRVGFGEPFGEVSGRWNAKTRRERGDGSRSSRKNVSTPVDS